MDVRDVRRLTASSLVLGAAMLLWLVFLALDDADAFDWSWPTAALKTLRFEAWMWIGAGVLAFLLAVVGLAVFGVGQGGAGKAPTRQVQCQDCKAVFFMPDNGRRPLTYPCPSCKALGVYDGKAAPIGTAPIVPVQKIARISLTCRSCQGKVVATDTGVRPLSIECPSCKAVGVLR